MGCQDTLGDDLGVSSRRQQPIQNGRWDRGQGFESEIACLRCVTVFEEQWFWSRLTPLLRRPFGRLRATKKPPDRAGLTAVRFDEMSPDRLRRPRSTQ